MIKPFSKNDTRNQNRILRHSSQLAMRKLSNSRATSPKDHNNDTDLNHIKRTSFWMKKTVCSQGIQNMIPNQPKKPGSARSRKVLSMKIKTHTSDAQSQFPKQPAITNSHDINSKLALVEKHQRDLATEVSLITQEKLSKLSHCENLFQSLNKILMMIASNNILQDSYPSLTNILKRHIDTTSQIMEKFKAYAVDYVNSHKCEDLIAKTIVLEKENLQLMNGLVSKQAQIRQIRKEGVKKNTEASIDFNLNTIDCERLYMWHANNYLNSNLRGNKKQVSCSTFLCDRLFDRTLEICKKGKKTLLSSKKFTILNELLDELLSTKQNFAVFGNLIEYASPTKDSAFTFNKNSQITSSKQTFPQTAVSQILLSKFDYKLFESIQLSFQNKSTQKFSILDLLVSYSRFKILDNQQKVLQILNKLLSKMRNTDKNYLNPEHFKQILDYIQQNHPIQEKQSLGSKQSNNSHSHLHSQQQQINRMKSKRLLNCISLFQGKKSTRPYSIISNKPSASIFQDQLDNSEFLCLTEHDNEGKKYFAAGQIQIEYSELVLFIYYFCKEQLDYLQKSLAAYLKIDPSQNCVSFVNRLVTKDVQNIIARNCQQQISAIGAVAGQLLNAYGYTKTLADQGKQKVSTTIIKSLGSYLFQ